MGVWFRISAIGDRICELAEISFTESKVELGRNLCTERVIAVGCFNTALVYLSSNLVWSIPDWYAEFVSHSTTSWVSTSATRVSRQLSQSLFWQCSWTLEDHCWSFTARDESSVWYLAVYHCTRQHKGHVILHKAEPTIPQCFKCIWSGGNDDSRQKEHGSTYANEVSCCNSRILRMWPYLFSEIFTNFWRLVSFSCENDDCSRSPPSTSTCAHKWAEAGWEWGTVCFSIRCCERITHLP